MAVKTITPVKGEVNKITKYAPVAAESTADGFEFKLPRMTDEYIVIMVQNSGSGAATIALKAPTNGSYAAASSDETLELAANEFAFIRFESARYANYDGTVKLVPNNAAVKLAVLY